jgi:hypothetical protein
MSKPAMQTLLDRWTEGAWMHPKGDAGYRPPLTNAELKHLSDALTDVQSSTMQFGSLMEMVCLWTQTHRNQIDAVLIARAERP